MFGYGTLKTEQPNHGLLTDPSVGKATFVGRARTNEQWPLVIATNLNIPFLLHVPGTGYVSSQHLLIDTMLTKHFHRMFGERCTKSMMKSFHTWMPLKVAPSSMIES